MVWGLVVVWLCGLGTSGGVGVWFSFDEYSSSFSLKSRKEEKALLSGLAKGLCTNRSIKTLT